jgi:hypothetical protein
MLESLPRPVLRASIGGIGVSLICIGLGLPLSVSARCGNSGIWVWPGDSAIQPEQSFLVEGFGKSQQIVRALGKGFKVLLRSTAGDVELLLVERHDGDKLLTAVLMRPATTLVGGTTYEFLIEGLPENAELVYSWNTGPFDREAPRWIVSNTTGAPQPGLLELPVVRKKNAVRYGCGPEVWVEFQILPEGNSESLVRISLRRGVHGTTSTFILPAVNGVVQVGQTMCSGALVFKEGSAYSVTFEMIGSAGKPQGARTAPLTFTAPGE